MLTSGGDQQAGGAAKLSKAGRYVRVIDTIDPRGIDTRASIMAHLNVLNRMNADNAPSDSWPTDTVLHGGVVALLERRGRTAPARRVGAHRRRHDRLLPALRRHQHWRDFRRERISAFRSGTRRQHRRRHRRLESRDRDRRAGREPGGRHGHRARAAAGSATKPMSPTTATWSPSFATACVRLIAKGMSLEQVKRAKPTLDYDGTLRRSRRTGRARCSSRPSIAI